MFKNLKSVKNSILKMSIGINEWPHSLKRLPHFREDVLWVYSVWGELTLVLLCKYVKINKLFIWLLMLYRLYISLEK